MSGIVVQNVDRADRAVIADLESCGNILAGVGPFAIERGLVAATGDETKVTPI